MSVAAAFASRPAHAVPGWLPALALIAGTALVGPHLGGAVRPLFCLGALLAGRYAWLRSPGEHLQAVLALLAFAPFLRRLVDLSQGFDPSGLMVAAPLLALMAPLPELRALTVPQGRGTDGRLLPFLISAGCVLYCVLLTVAQGEWSQAATGLLKWAAPLVYALALVLREPDARDLIASATRAFALILPIIGIYGIYQYVAPPLWDCYWLKQAAITSAGLPEPYAVRTFSTMHGPAVFATFAATGIVLVYLFGRGLLARLAMAPALLALCLSLYRTAWISLAVSLLFCLLFRETRARAGRAWAILAAGGAAAVLFTPFGDVLIERFSTFGEGSEDGSGKERLGEFETLWGQPAGGLFGFGFPSVDTGAAGAAPLDGMIAICWACMGIVVGLVSLAALVYAIFWVIWQAVRDGSREAIALGGLACGWLVQLPLAAIASAELGFFFWTTVAMAYGLRREGGRP